MASIEALRNANCTEPGRPFAREYEMSAKPAEKIAKKISADLITVFGAAAGISGSYLLGFPDQAAETLCKISKGRLNLTHNQVRVTGAILLGVGYVCDLLDGAVARKSEEGETKHGKVIDGIVDKMIDISPAVFTLATAQSFDDKVTWQAYEALAPVSTMIRSRGLAHDIPIAKTGVGARIGRLPFLISSLVFKDKRNLLGKVMNVQLVADCIHRYVQIVRSGNQEAIQAVHADLTQYIAWYAASRVSGLPPLEQELATVGLELSKLTQVKIKEAYK